MKQFKLLVFSILLLLVFDVSAQSPWTLDKDKDGIKVYTRKVEGHKLKQLRAMATIDAPLSVVDKILVDFSNHVKWVDNCSVSEILENKDANDCIFYNTYNLPWPVKNRDVVTHILVTREKDKLSNVSFSALPNYIENKDGYVRVPYSEGTWILKSLAKNKTEVIYTLHASAGGSIPSWLVNELLVKSPYKTIKNLKNKAEE